MMSVYGVLRNYQLNVTWERSTKLARLLGCTLLAVFLCCVFFKDLFCSLLPFIMWALSTYWVALRDVQLKKNSVVFPYWHFKKSPFQLISASARKRFVHEPHFLLIGQLNGGFRGTGKKVDWSFSGLTRHVLLCFIPLSFTKPHLHKKKKKNMTNYEVRPYVLDHKSDRDSYEGHENEKFLTAEENGPSMCF